MSVGVRILIVDDDTQKLGRITRALLQVEGLEDKDIDSAIDINSAKERLRATSYDLLVLDIAVPTRIEQRVVADAGIRLLDELTERGGYKVPSHIVGITAYGDLLAKARERFSERLFTVIPYQASSEDWIAPLTARARHIVQSKSAREPDPLRCESHLAVVCALPSPELSSVLHLNWSWEQVLVPNDEAIYYRGQIEGEGVLRTVHAAAAPRKGMPAATILSMKMIQAFRPEYIVIVGITAGLSGKTNFGDVLAADPSWDWGSGKWAIQQGKPVFQPAPHQLPLEPRLRNKLNRMSSDAAALSLIRENWPADKPSHVIRLHVGPLASGASVLADGSMAQSVIQQHRDLIGLDMETYGVFAAAEECAAPRPIPFALKSVVDFADGEKNDRYQKYAAYTSAQTLELFVRNYL